MEQYFIPPKIEEQQLLFEIQEYTCAKPVRFTRTYKTNEDINICKSEDPR